MAIGGSWSRIAKFLGIAVLVLSVSMATGRAVSANQAAAPQAAPKVDHPEFPMGQGRDTTLRLCSKCHSVNNVLATGRDRQGWQDLIVKMASMGMSATDEELSDISDYLTASFPPTGTKLNVNKATATQLATSLGMTADEAKEVVSYREKNGDFKSLDDLKKVPNVDAKKLDAKKDLLLFS